MNIIELLNAVNEQRTIWTLSEVLWELLESGYDLVMIGDQWMLVDDCTYQRPLWTRKSCCELKGNR